MADAMRAQVGALLKGIDRYNPENLVTLEKYINMQAQENTYDLEANLAVLKLYQFNPNHYQTTVAAQVLLKALTNLPHTDFTLCKCLIDLNKQEEEPIMKVMHIAEMLEMCQFKSFWECLKIDQELSTSVHVITGFEDSIRKFVCHVVSTTYQTIPFDTLTELLGNIPESQVKQWISKYGWSLQNDGNIYITNQEENIKTKNITEKITFESVAGIMAAYK
ncbi:eukaryotic translation initiation factor 3 subunit K-like [Mytilus galloprovincialis]|uniref:Eukaryotic translation initiation factor 3 subunit K n=1 Tax=Mytilus galloprovincialis TaxID=29158 RepID=A0A8B6CJD6_MYTGA|nr:translation initiation factor 3 subunit K [Mytilus galloprovincialis]